MLHYQMSVGGGRCMTFTILQSPLRPLKNVRGFVFRILVSSYLYQCACHNAPPKISLCNLNVCERNVFVNKTRKRSMRKNKNLRKSVKSAGDVVSGDSSTIGLTAGICNSNHFLEAAKYR